MPFKKKKRKEKKKKSWKRWALKILVGIIIGYLIYHVGSFYIGVQYFLLSKFDEESKKIMNLKIIDEGERQINFGDDFTYRVGEDQLPTFEGWEAKKYGKDSILGHYKNKKNPSKSFDIFIPKSSILERYINSIKSSFKEVGFLSIPNEIKEENDFKFFINLLNLTLNDLSIFKSLKMNMLIYIELATKAAFFASNPSKVSTIEINRTPCLIMNFNDKEKTRFFCFFRYPQNLIETKLFFENIEEDEMYSLIAGFSKFFSKGEE